MNHSEKQTSAADPLAFLTGGGEMGRLMRAQDWSATALGPVSGWPQSLKTAVRIILGSRYPMFIWWGRELVNLYNDGYLPMLGQRHPAALGKPAAVIWSEIWDAIGPQTDAVLSEGRATWNEERLLVLERNGYPEEAYFTFSYSPVPADDGGVGGIFCALTEDTQRVLGQRRLRTLRELSARTTGARTVEQACQAATDTLAQNPHDLPFALIYLLDGQGKVARLAGTTGLADDPPAHPASIDLMSSDGRSACWPLDRVAATGRAELVEGLEARCGRLRCGVWPEPPHSAIVLPVMQSGQDRLAGFVVAGISPRRVFDDDYRGFADLLAGHIATAVANARAYEEEKRRAEALAELDRAKTVFFSNVSHEFRTPLTLMLGPVGDLLAGSRTDLSPAVADQLEVVNRNGLRLLRLVNTLLDFSRIEAGRLRAGYQPTDLAAFTADLASVFRAAVEKAGLRLSIDCPPLGEPVFVDPEMWEQVVLNLLSNAFKFTFDGEIAVTLKRVGDAAELRVSDTGTGIPPEEMPRLFERFHRVHNARGRTHEGSGIGLALVQELVKLHGGFIAAESVVGQGTTFTVTVPLGSAHLPSDLIVDGRRPALAGTEVTPFVEEALRSLPNDAWDEHENHSELPAFQELRSAPYRQGQPEEADNRPRVLVADDNADMRQYVARLLAEEYRTEVVADGEAALAAARRQRPDLILTDVMMPRLDGFALLREIRADQSLSGLPVILLSARAGEESRVEGMKAGADDYLVKPFGARELLARVSAHLQMARLRRESERAVRESEERFRAFVSASSDVVYRMSADWSEMRFLQGRDFVADTEEPSRTWPEKYIDPDDQPHVMKAIGEAVRTRSVFELEHRVRRLDGTVGWTFSRAVPLLNPDGEVVEWFGAASDITDRKRAEESTHKQSEQLRRLAEVATRLTAASDVASITEVVTEEARTLIGSHQAVTSFTTDQNWGQAINTVSLSEKYARWRRYDEKPDGSGIYSLVCRTNEPLRMTQAELEEHPAYKRFGTHVRHHPPLRGWLAAPLVGRDGRNIGLIQLSDKYEGEFTAEDEAILVQLTQMASVAVENARLVQDLRNGDRRKDEFLATLAHELRNPLAPIRNSLQILKMPRLDAATIERSRDMMERQVHQLVRLVDDLLDVSRVMRGKIELRNERVELATVVARAVETAQPLIEGQGHELTVSLPSESLSLEADPVRLAQVVGNLLTNSAKYTEANGRIGLTAEREGDVAVLRVRDNGIGIAPDVLPHIFELFVQADHSSTKAQGGLGIGLTLVKNLVEMHHGTVVAHSAGLGAGCEFVIRLPLMPQEERQRVVDDNGEAPHDPARSSGHRLLVVDDNRDAADSLAMLLRLQGHEVRVAHDGPDALETVKGYRPELVFLDIGMPGMDGYEVARRLRRQPGLENVRLAALTGWGQQEDRRCTAEAGFDHHLVKPVEPNALAGVLAELRPAGVSGR